MNGPVVLGIFFILGVCAIFVTMYYYNRNKEGFKNDNELRNQVHLALTSWEKCTGNTPVEQRYIACKKAIGIMLKVTDKPMPKDFIKQVGRNQAQMFRNAVESVGAIYEAADPYYKKNV